MSRPGCKTQHHTCENHTMGTLEKWHGCKNDNEDNEWLGGATTNHWSLCDVFVHVSRQIEYLIC